MTDRTTISGAARRPPLRAPLYVTDGGLETTLVFAMGVDLPDFAAFPLLDRKPDVLATYFAPYLEIAARDDVGLVLDTPTWRASADWGARLGYAPDALAALNRRAVDFVRGLAGERRGLDCVANGVIGPRGDGYAVEEAMSAAEAARYHRLQARAFAEAGADLVTAVTMTHAAEAIGIARAALAEALPVAISFTVETDGRLPSGQRLGDAIQEVDAATAGAVAYFMINCAHPSHFAAELEAGGAWIDRIEGVRANASRRSHAELDAAETLDRGCPAELARDYRALRAALPRLRVVGGCCGTDHEHVGAISRALSEGRDPVSSPGETGQDALRE